MHWLLPTTILLAQLGAALPQAADPAATMAVPFPDANTPEQIAANRAASINHDFQFAWSGYSAFAFPNDELEPVTDGYINPRNGWGASAVDALSTAIVMQDKMIVNQILDHIAVTDFSKSIHNTSVDLFETTIRYLAGMLSGYDLLTNVYPELANSVTNVELLLDQAKNLADNLAYCFDTPTGIPNNYIYFNPITASTSTDGTNGLATIGSLVLEWTHLSDLTGNMTYAALAQKGESYLLNPMPASSSPWPGLLGTNVNITTGEFLDDAGGWVGGDDSFYEYLIKMYVYDSTRFGQYKDRWVQAVESSIEHLLVSPAPRPDVKWLAAFSGQQLQNYSEHLACFDGGNFILGGTVLNRPDITQVGLELVAGCHEAYISTAAGIAPEVWSWDTTGIPANQMVFYEDNGFYIDDGVYVLRPEYLESVYYAWQVTGNVMYQDWSWSAWQSIVAATKVRNGFSDTNNVNKVGGGKKLNVQESFLFAEVMKYAYLTQRPNEVYDVQANGTNMWVYNTECHPFKVAHVVSPPS